MRGLGSKEGRWPGSLSGQNGLCSTGGARAGLVDADAVVLAVVGGIRTQVLGLLHCFLAIITPLWASVTHDL